MVVPVDKLWISIIPTWQAAVGHVLCTWLHGSWLIRRWEEQKVWGCLTLMLTLMESIHLKFLLNTFPKRISDIRIRQSTELLPNRSLPLVQHPLRQTRSSKWKQASLCLRKHCSALPGLRTQITNDFGWFSIWNGRLSNIQPDFSRSNTSLFNFVKAAKYISCHWSNNSVTWHSRHGNTGYI